MVSSCYCLLCANIESLVNRSKDGNPIREDARYTIESDSSTGKHRIAIRDATLNDEGTYRCAATNDSGSATTRAFVRIDGKLL
jgi:hypothetical protein